MQMRYSIALHIDNIVQQHRVPHAHLSAFHCLRDARCSVSVQRATE